MVQKGFSSLINRYVTVNNNLAAVELGPVGRGLYVLRVHLNMRNVTAPRVVRVRIRKDVDKGDVSDEAIIAELFAPYNDMPIEFCWKFEQFSDNSYVNFSLIIPGWASGESIPVSVYLEKIS